MSEDALPLDERVDPVLPPLVAEPADVDAIGAMLVEAFEASNPITEEYRSVLLNLADFTARNDILWIPERRDRTPLAAVVMPRARPDGRIRPEVGFRMLGVHPRARGHGLGRVLVDACLSAARRQGAARMTIYSGPEMTQAHRLYRTQGFVRWPERETIVVDGGRTLVCFTRLLADAGESGPPSP